MNPLMLLIFDLVAFLVSFLLAPSVFQDTEQSKTDRFFLLLVWVTFGALAGVYLYASL